MILKNILKDQLILSLRLLDVGNSYTTGIIFNNCKYSFVNKDIFNMNKYFRTTFKTLMNVIWEQHSKNTNINEKDKIMESLKNEYEYIWKEIRYSCFNKSCENNILSVLLKDKGTNRELLCLNIHNPCWWLDDKNISKVDESMICEDDGYNKSIQTQINNINPRKYFDEDILYILRNISIHKAINILLNNIILSRSDEGLEQDEYNPQIIFAGDFNIQGNSDYDVSNHLDGVLQSSNIKIFNDKINKINFNTSKLFNTNFNLLNCHKKYYPSNENKPGKVKIRIYDKEKKCKVEKDVNFYTQKSFDKEKILDRIYISNDFEINENMVDIIEEKFCSDHVILSVYLEYKRMRRRR
jgi:hypothetical protein